jgi:transposase
MKSVRYSAEFKAEAVRQVSERGHGDVDVAKKLGMPEKILYQWVRLAKDRVNLGGGETAQPKAEVSRLKADLTRANEKRDILKKAATYFAKLSG